jgi:hypothetical protein
MREVEKRRARLWSELEGLVERLPTEEAASEGEGLSLWLPDDRYHKLTDQEKFLLDKYVEGNLDRDREEVSAEGYLYGRLIFQICRRLKKYVEQQELSKVQEIWGEFTANVGYLEDEPIPSFLQERGEIIIDQLQALSLRQEILMAVSFDPNAGASEITLDLVDPLLLDLLAKNPNLLKTLEWRTFEKLLARILADLGYEIELQGGTKDGGVDIFALKRDSIFGSHRYLLQAKRWSHAVGVEPVRELLFLHGHHRMTRSCLATTSRFTSGAWELARDYAWQLELRDFDKLLEWINLSRASGRGRSA